MSSPERIPHEQAPDIRSGHVTTYVEPEQDVAPSVVDALAEDAKAADEPPEYPDGAPEFYPLLRMPYRRRAAAIRKYGELQAYLAAHPELQKTNEKAEKPDTGEDAVVDTDSAADSYEMVAVMDEFMESVAKVPDEYEVWVDRYDVDKFMATWAAYQAATQPGEASSSSS